MNIFNKLKAMASRLIIKTKNFISYSISGVWNDPRRTTGVRLLRTVNLAVNSFLDRGLQNRSMALTYSTVLAMVPAIALLVAIGRGFGLQESLQEELYNFFPSQHKAISTALQFVDSYLNSATQGVFVGAGIIFLLWTVISLLSSIEDAFNTIWDVKHDRSLFKKVTDYIAICLIIPILMICSSGVSIFMSTTIQDNLSVPFLTPVVNIILEAAPVILYWIAFSLSYLLIPNTKVNIKYACISGAICAVAFTILQLLFVNGQIYVSKYNAIYGSFAFLPLLLIWLQLSWLLLLSGCVLTYSLQNVFTFNFNSNSDKLSIDGWNSVALIVMSVIAQRFIHHKKPISEVEIAQSYDLPIRLVTRIVQKFHSCGLTYTVQTGDDAEGEVPAIELGAYTVADFMKKYNSAGDIAFLPNIRKIYADLFAIILPIRSRCYDEYSSILVRDLPIPTPNQINSFLNSEAAGLSVK
ncbi:MAG: YihY/virulence factor BrkB family protein [Muribaculaceae bacterium]|nr:YihY/virulence factor BrkB family protein [Muribaculaceae bacterium]